MTAFGLLTMKNLAPVLLVGMVFVIIILLALLIRFIYNMSLNRSVKHGLDGNPERPQLHSAAPDPSSIFFLLVTGILIAMIIFLVVQNVKLNDELSDLKDSVDRLHETVSFDVNRNISNIDDKLYETRQKLNELTDAFRTIALTQKWITDPFFLTDDPYNRSQELPGNEEPIIHRLEDYCYDFDFCSYDAETGTVPFTLTARFTIKDAQYYRIERAYLNYNGKEGGFRYFEGTSKWDENSQTITVKGQILLGDLDLTLYPQLVIYFPDTEGTEYALPVQKAFLIQSLDTSHSEVSIRSYASSKSTIMNVNLYKPFLPVYRDKIKKAEFLILSGSDEVLYDCDITYSTETGSFVLTDYALPYVADLTGAQAAVRITNEDGYQMIIRKFPNETSIGDQMMTNTSIHADSAGSMALLGPDGNLIFEFP
ncbi:MAG: hypothetical protein J5643_09630 [Lachnospiraceae bacterium]|nr:hypothetical protein [Lachnospiraceae bacterium]